MDALLEEGKVTEAADLVLMDSSVMVTPGMITTNKFKGKAKIVKEWQSYVQDGVSYLRRDLYALATKNPGPGVVSRACTVLLEKGSQVDLLETITFNPEGRVVTMVTITSCHHTPLPPVPPPAEGVCRFVALANQMDALLDEDKLVEAADLVLMDSSVMVTPGMITKNKFKGRAKIVKEWQSYANDSMEFVRRNTFAGTEKERVVSRACMVCMKGLHIDLVDTITFTPEGRVLTMVTTTA